MENIQYAPKKNRTMTFVQYEIIKDTFQEGFTIEGPNGTQVKHGQWITYDLFKGVISMEKYDEGTKI